jgi:glucose/arabinose dehydrogenase
MSITTAGRVGSVAAFIVSGLVLASGAAAQRGGSMADIWKNDCASCHGGNGTGREAGAEGGAVPSLLDAKWRTDGTDRGLYDAIRNGIEGVEGHAFSGTRSNAEVWSMVVHIRELRAHAERRANGSPKATDGVYASQHARYTVTTIVEGLSIPWGVDFIPAATPKGLETLAGAMIITERPGGVRLATRDSGMKGEGPWTLLAPIAGTPDVAHVGQGGMMEVAVHPDFATNGWIYLGFTDPADPPAEGGAPRRATTMTKIVRGTLAKNGDAWTWSDEKTIFEAPQATYLGGGLHFGCRIVFDPPTPGPVEGARHLYWAIGERGRGDHAQDLTRPNGKIHRLVDDGSIPADNPFVDEASKAKGVLPSIWSYGHRNPQGLVMDLDGVLWGTEHGPRGGDELNVITRGANYGWPLVSFGVEYSGSPRGTPWPDEIPEASRPSVEITMPKFVWLPSIGACGLDVARPGPDGEAFAAWRNDLFAGGLSGANVDRLRVRDGVVVEREEIVHGMGRVRDVATAPDGSILVVLNDPDSIVRIAPAE